MPYTHIHLILLHYRRWFAKPLTGIKQQLAHVAKALAGGAKKLGHVVNEARKDPALQAAAVGFAMGFTLAEAASKPHCTGQPARPRGHQRR